MADAIFKTLQAWIPTADDDDLKDILRAVCRESERRNREKRLKILMADRLQTKVPE